MKRALHLFVVFILFFQAASIYGGAGVAHAEEEFTPVSIGFEAEEARIWYGTTLGGYTWGPDTAVAHSGLRAMKLTNLADTVATNKVDVNNTKTTAPVTAPDIEVIAGKKYTVEFWYNTTNYQKVGTSGSASITLQPYYNATALQKQVFFGIPVPAGGNSGWVKKTLTIDLTGAFQDYSGNTREANRLRILMRLSGATGEVYFDDFQIYEEGQSPSPSPTVTPTATPTTTPTPTPTATSSAEPSPSATPTAAPTPTPTPTAAPSATPTPAPTASPTGTPPQGGAGGDVFQAGFESSDIISWTEKEAGMEADYDSTVKRSGERSLKLYNSSGTEDTSSKVDVDNLVNRRPNVPITGGKTYELEFWYLPQDYAKIVSSAGVVITLLPYSGTKQLSGTASLSIPTAAVADWTKQTIRYALPQTITDTSGQEYVPDSLRVLIRFSGAKGTVWLDDFSMKALYANDSQNIGQPVIEAGFEEGESAAWTPTTLGHNVYLDPTMSFSGEQALKLFNPTGSKDTGYKAVYENVVDGMPLAQAEAARSYTLSFRYYTRDYKKFTADGGATISVYPYSGKTMLRDYQKSFNIPDAPMSGWTRKAIAFDLPPTILDYNNVERVPDRIRVYIKFANGRGAVWFDDVSILTGVMNLAGNTSPILDQMQTAAVESRLQGTWALLAGSSVIYAEHKKSRLNDNDADIQPLLQDGKLYVPVQFAVDKLADGIAWNATAGTLTLNGTPVALEASPLAAGGTTYIPLLALADALGKAAYYNDNGLLLISDTQVVTPGVDDGLVRDMMRYLNSAEGVIAKPVLLPNEDLPDSAYLPAPEYYGQGMLPSDPSIVLTENTRAALDAALANFTFKHEGMLNTVDELMFIKSKIDAGEEPWASSFEKMKKSKYASKTYTPSPVAVPSAGISGANDQGANAESMDTAAAYTQALMWIFTGEEVYARNAVTILNAWADVLESHGGANWYLQAAWAGSKFPAAAELIRATYSGWSQEEIDAFSAMLNRAFLPLLNQRMAYGNRLLSVSNALIAIGVFNEDKAALHQGLLQYLSYLPSYVYLSQDGDKPIPADYWQIRPTNEEYYQMHSGLYSREESWVFVPNNPKPGVYGEDNTMLLQYGLDQQWYYPDVYIDGLSAETSRDLGHVELSIGAVSNISEIAWNQGIDIYTLFKDRLKAFMEVNAALRLGYVIPNTLHGGTIDPQNISPTYEIMYNHLHNRLGMELPVSKAFINPYIRAAEAWGTVVSPDVFATSMAAQANLHMLWETLTHAQLNNRASAPPLPPADPSVIEGSLGGSFIQGALSLHVPPQTFGGTIAISVSEATYVPPVENGTVISSVYNVQKDKAGSFYKPVTVTINVYGNSLDTALYDYGLYEYNDSLAKWVKLTDIQLDPAAGTVSGTVKHFGTFAVLEMEKLPPPVIEPGGRIPAVSVTASDHDGNLPEFAVDSDLTTRWSAMGEQWLELDLGQIYSIDSAGIAFQSGDARASKFQLEVSADGENWTTVFDGQSAGNTTAVEIFAFDGIDARYVRYNGHGNTVNGWNSIRELEIYKS
ncbi:MAG: secreted protein [Paenibacillaceae bacterium]|jgi:hypothetical protein|nr:secreted protein [Paenibacillaceae bacterium]